MTDAIEFHLRAVLGDAAELGEPHASRLPIDRYVAASLVQKAIRRGEMEWATDAAFTLLRIDSRYLWRRLIITLFEDVGLHDARLAWRVLASRQHCLQLGTVAWPIVQLIVSEMSRSQKSQAGNHALHLATAEKREPRSGDFLVDLPLADVMRWANEGDRSIPERVHAIWAISGLGLGGVSPPIQHPEGSIGAGWAALDQLVPDGEIRALARSGVQAGGSILAISAALTAHSDCERSGRYHCASDPMPPSSLIGEVPSWAFDMYTRTGKRALALACNACPAIHDVLQRHGVPFGKRPSILANAQFEFESACLGARIQHPRDLALLARARAMSASPWLQEPCELIVALQRDWNAFQKLRARSMGA